MRAGACLLGAALLVLSSSGGSARAEPLQKKVGKASLIKLLLDLKVKSDPSFKMAREERRKKLASLVAEAITARDPDQAARLLDSLLSLSTSSQEVIHKHARDCLAVAKLYREKKNNEKALSLAGEGIVFARADRESRKVLPDLLRMYGQCLKDTGATTDSAAIESAARAAGQKGAEEALLPVKKLLDSKNETAIKKLKSLKKEETEKQATARLKKEMVKLEGIKDRNFRQSHRLAAVYDELSGKARRLAGKPSGRSLAQKKADLVYLEKALEQYRRAARLIGKDKVLARFKDAPLIYSSVVVDGARGDYSQLLAEVADQEIKSNDFKNAEISYKKLIDENQSNPEPLIRVDAFWRYACCLVARDRGDSARDFYKNLQDGIKDDPSLGDFRKELIANEASILAGADRSKDLKSLNRARDLTAYFLIAERLRKEKKFAQANAPYRSLLEVAGTDAIKPEYIRGYAANLVSQGKKKEARALYTRLYDKSPDLKNETSKYRKDELSLFGS
ncbi:MAG: hypothetical protein KC777_24950 [Cyanobacteria bacterium HKST-UBA02]|nr:hypothetical protein [Cyanobacteria bacterium HKST-UBA02]